MKLSKTYNLKAVNPGLASQWHPLKNGDLKPEDVTPGSGKKVWWLCEKGHEWQAFVFDRNNGSGCPYCTGRKVNKDNCLKTKNPSLAREWHPVKNGDLTPEDVTPSSNKKAWWLCENGHEWQARVYNRNEGNGCPFCTGRRVNKENCLKTRNPSLALQWHPVKNGDLTPEDVTPSSNKKVWWLCAKGHEWQAFVFKRTRGNACPYCAGKKASKDNCLKSKNPSLVRQWHPVKNGDLTPEDVTPGSRKKTWWVCEKGHEWQAVVKNRNNNQGCPYCSSRRVNKENSLKTKNPSLARQWHPEKNGDLRPEDVVPGSVKKVWWICEKGHEWQATINKRASQNMSCPFCALKSTTYALPISNPELAELWHPEKNGNLTPEDIIANSARKVWWLCKKGHEWQEKVYLQDRSNGCPICHKDNPGEKKLGYKFLLKASRGFNKPIVCSGTSQVTTMLEEKVITNRKGKIKEIRKFTTYARYVYGLDRIPEGWVIWHIDGDPFNNKIENLECISRGELLRRNRMRRYNKNP